MKCGIPDPDETTYSPILNWSICNVVDWLTGMWGTKRETRMMEDLLVVSRQLVAIYDVRVDRNVFDGFDPDVEAARFGCIGCPAIQANRNAPASSIRRYGPDSPLHEIYDVWFEARRRRNRCYKPGFPEGGKSKLGGFGPIRMEVRKHLFARVMDIQQRAGVVLVTPEDEAFIRECWEKSVYPRGWSVIDELTQPPSDMPLFDGMEEEDDQSQHP